MHSLFLNDIHFPYQDDHALSLVFKLIKYLQPSEVFLIGDIIDCYSLSRFDKDPNLVNLQEDLDLLEDFFYTLRQHTDARITYLEGNHEHRLTRFLFQNPEIRNLKTLTPQNLFNLETYGVEWIPQEKTHIHNGHIITHGSVVRKHAGYSAKAELEKYGCSGISGHTHRVGVYNATNMLGTHTWIENGCLCKPMDYVIGTPNWQQSVSVQYSDGPIQTYRITDTLVFDGKVL
jgi:predicted phosphodiesterase